MGQGGEVAQLEGVVAGHPVVLADRGEDLGLLDRVHPEVGLQVEVDVEQIRRIAGELGDDADHDVGDLVPGRCRRGRLRCRHRSSGRRFRSRDRSRRLASAGGAATPVLSRIQPMTWVRVGKSRSWRLSSRATP